MLDLGVSLHIGTLLDEPETDAQAQLLDGFSGAAGLLAYLTKEGVKYIEVRNVRAHMPTERSVRAIKAVHAAGFSTSLHIAFESTSGQEYADRVASVFEAALSGQREDVILTVHPLSGDEKTANAYADWACAISGFDPRLRLVLENMRVRKPNTDYNRLSHVINNIKSVKKELRGACFDMGHYAYNVVKDGLPIETAPPEEQLREIAHTHIHSLYIPDLDTHFPLMSENDPAASYIRALKAVGYGGIYNLELEPERFTRVINAREGFERSVASLKEILK